VQGDLENCTQYHKKRGRMQQTERGVSKSRGPKEESGTDAQLQFVALQIERVERGEMHTDSERGASATHTREKTRLGV
jgi:hypothetical protein